MSSTLTIKCSSLAAHEATYTHGNIPSDAITAALENTVGTPSAENPVVLASDVPESGGGLDLSYSSLIYLPFKDPIDSGIITNYGALGAQANFNIH